MVKGTKTCFEDSSSTSRQQSKSSWTPDCTQTEHTLLISRTHALSHSPSIGCAGGDGQTWTMGWSSSGVSRKAVMFRKATSSAPSS